MFINKMYTLSLVSVHLQCQYAIPLPTSFICHGQLDVHKQTVGLLAAFTRAILDDKQNIMYNISLYSRACLSFWIFYPCCFALLLALFFSLPQSSTHLKGRLRSTGFAQCFSIVSLPLSIGGIRIWCKIRTHTTLQISILTCKIATHNTNT